MVLTAPALLDDSEYVSKWIKLMIKADPDADDTTEDTGTTGLETHLRKMNSLMNSAEREMGRVPSDLASVLADMAIGSFAVCAFRQTAEICEDHLNWQRFSSIVSMQRKQQRRYSGLWG